MRAFQDQEEVMEELPMGPEGNSRSRGRRGHFGQLAEPVLYKLQNTK